ncbi:MAG: hypothetical protein M9921_08085 [Fimbriimonadaceae bacterium]|nr:hypothetical protein [Fimbriimonadaceae bacterium]
MVFTGISLSLTVIGVIVGFSCTYAIIAACAVTITYASIVRIRSLTIETSFLAIVVLVFWGIAGVLFAIKSPSDQAEALVICDVAGIFLFATVYIAMRVCGVRNFRHSAYWVVAILASSLPGLVRQMILER